MPAFQSLECTLDILNTAAHSGFEVFLFPFFFQVNIILNSGLILLFVIRGLIHEVKLHTYDFNHNCQMILFFVFVKTRKNHGVVSSLPSWWSR